MAETVALEQPRVPYALTPFSSILSLAHLFMHCKKGGRQGKASYGTWQFLLGLKARGLLATFS